MAVQRCILVRNIFWPTRLHFDGLTYTHRMFSWHSEIRMMNIEISRNSSIKKFSLRICGSSRMLSCLTETSRNYYSSTSKILNYSKEDSNDSDDDAEEKIYKKGNTHLATIFENKTEMSSPEWEDVIEQVSQEERKMNTISCDALMIKRCQMYSNYPLATSYLEHIKRQGRKPNLATLGIYLELCGKTVTQCGEERVLEIYHQLCSQVKMLDSKLSKSAILGLTSTREWKQAFKHLPVIRKMSQVCHKTYSVIIAAAFRNSEYDTGWQYLEAMCREEKVPLDEVFLEWLRQCDRAEETEDKKKMAFTLLNKLGLYEIFPKVPIIQEIAKLFTENIGWSGLYVKIPPSGRCPACKYQLEGLEIDKKEFKQLQEEFVPRVLQGSDIFLSSSPKEWDEFCSFVEEHKPFTVVVDGLNVAYITGNKSPMNRGYLVRDVMEKVLKKYPGGQVLVIGRKHLTQWLPQNFRSSKKSVRVYTVNNLTKDDGFFIYAALQSGLGTKFISSDMLRDHLFRLGQAPLRETFRRWQRIHQVMAVSLNSQIHLMDPAAFSTTAQDGGPGWHIPYDDGSPRYSYELPKTWLCLQPVMTRRKRKSSRSESAYSGTVRDVPFEYELDGQSANWLKIPVLEATHNRPLPKMKAAPSRGNGLVPPRDYGNRYPLKRKAGKNDSRNIRTLSLTDILYNDDKE